MGSSLRGEDGGGTGELHPARLLRMLGAGSMYGPVVLFDRVDSTNTAALAAARAGSREGTVFAAELQRVGRGRRGRHWFSAERSSLSFSVALRPGERREGITSLFAICAVRALSGTCGGVMIKWPNDLIISGGKVAGILAEAGRDHVVIGMGINVNQHEGDFPAWLAGGAASLAMAAGSQLDRGGILVAILGEFETAYRVWKHDGLAPFVREIEQRLLLLGNLVTVESGDERVEGTVRGITDEGYLRLSVGAGERVVASGDLAVRKEIR